MTLGDWTSLGQAIALSCKFTVLNSASSPYFQGLDDQYVKNFLIDPDAKLGFKLGGPSTYPVIEVNQSWQAKYFPSLEKSDFEYTLGNRSARKSENWLGETRYEQYWIRTRIDRVTLSIVQEEINEPGKDSSTVRVIGKGRCSIVPIEKVQGIWRKAESDRALLEEERQRLLESKKGERLI